MKRSPSSALSLPVLLSFNELAWIAILAMGIISSFSWVRSDTATKEAERLNAMVRDYSNEVARLQPRTGNLTTNLSYYINELKKLQKERDRFKQLVDLAPKSISQLTAELIAAQELNQKLSNSLLITSQRITTLTNALQAALAERKELTSVITRIEDQLRRNLALTTDLETVIHALQKELASWKAGAINQELLGLKGRMTNVVILLDRSGSMEIGHRWETALDTINAWLKHLPVRRFALITFNDQYEPLPETGMIDLQSPSGSNERDMLIGRLRDLKPAGNTDTLGAMEKAYSYENIDTIILCTDGAPYMPKDSKIKYVESNIRGGKIKYSIELIQGVLSLARKHPDIAVNTIGLGNYYEDKIMTTFLLNLSDKTGGVFLGR